MWFQLAEIMGIPVGILQRQISSREFTEWVAYYSLEPTPIQRSDVQTALICQTIQASTAGRKGRKPQLKDFLLKFESPFKKPAQDLKEKLLAWKSAYQGGKR